MQIRIDPNLGTFLYFPLSELRVALGVLKAIHKVCGAEFILTAINDIEAQLKPKLLTMVNYFHWCSTCGRDCDERDDNVMRITTDGDIQWRHKNCRPLNPFRPV